MASNILPRPKTTAEIQADKAKKRAQEVDKVRIYNNTDQTIPIQMMPREGKNVVNQVSIQLYPKKFVDIPRNRLLVAQINNLRKRGMIKVHDIKI